MGSVRGAGMLQVHGAQRRGGQGLLHGLRLRGRVRGRLPLLPRRRRVGGEHRGRHAVRGARHQRTGAAGAVRQRPEDGEDGREDTEEPVQDGLCPRPRPLPLHRTQPLPPSARTLPAGGADALAEGHRLVPQNLTHLSEQDTQRNYFLQRLVNFLLILERMLRTKLRKNVLDILVCDVSISMPTLKYTENNKKSNSFKIINDLFI